MSSNCAHQAYVYARSTISHHHSLHYLHPNPPMGSLSARRSCRQEGAPLRSRRFQVGTLHLPQRGSAHTVHAGTQIHRPLPPAKIPGPRQCSQCRCCRAHSVKAYKVDVKQGRTGLFQSFFALPVFQVTMDFPTFQSFLLIRFY